jgi:ketosteroid isomerase-like protein
MKRQKKVTGAFVIGIIFCLAVIGSACAQHHKTPSVDLAREEQAIRDISMKWLEFANAHDISGKVALFADNCVIYRQNQEPAAGKAAITALFTQEERDRHPKSVFKWAADRIEMAASGDLAVEYGTWSESNAGMDGTEEIHGKYVTVYRKVNGVWKIISDNSITTKPNNEEP